MVTMLYRFLALEEQTWPELDGYTDAGQVSDWAQDAMCWAVANEMINGVSATELAPGSGASRAQVAVILMRVLTAEA